MQNELEAVRYGVPEVQEQIRKEMGMADKSNTLDYVGLMLKHGRDLAPATVVELMDYYDAELAALRARLEAAEAEAERLRGLLKKHQWSVPHWETYDLRIGDFCPECFCDERDGHKPTCAIAAALKGRTE